MGIAFGSIGTGLPKDIVKQIMSAERIPLQKMEERKSKITDKKGLVADLTQRVTDMRTTLNKNANARSLRELKVETNEDIIDVTVDKNIAQPGTYQIEVKSLAQKSSGMTSGFEDPEESFIGVGYIQYTLPDGETKDVYVDQNNSSLRGIAKLVNKDTNNGMRASVINDGSGTETPWRLLLSLDETGDEKLATFPYFYFIDGEDDIFLEFEREAHDAKIMLDGFEIEVPGNKANDLIPGVSLDLKKAKLGDEFSLKVGEDTQAVTSKISELVDGINNVIQFINEQNKLDEKTDTSRTLGGDVMLQTLESRLRGAVFKNVDTQFGMRRIGDLGVSFQRDGLLKLDDEKFNTKLNENYNEVTQILTGHFKEDGTKSLGFIDNLRKSADQTLRFPDGILPSRKNSLNTKIDQIDRRIGDRQRMLEEKEKNLKNKFSRLEGTIAKIKGQGAGVAALGGGGSNPVTQLG